MNNHDFGEVTFRLRQDNRSHLSVEQRARRANHDSPPLDIEIARCFARVQQQIQEHLLELDRVAHHL